MRSGIPLRSLASFSLVFVLFGCGQATSSHLQQIAATSSQTVIGAVPLNSNPNVSLGIPKMARAAEVVISRSQYVLSWNATTHNVNWAAWRLQASDLGQVDRQDSYAVDAELQNYLTSHGGGHAVTPKDYQGSCFDRGHQVPSADRTARSSDNNATFMMSNMLPQTPYLNRGIWEQLESYARAEAAGHRETSLYVIAGPVYGEVSAEIGPQRDIAVPSKNFKVIVEMAHGSSEQKVLAAVMMPNVRSSQGVDASEDNCFDDEDASTDIAALDADAWKKYSVPVAEIEAAAAIELNN